MFSFSKSKNNKDMSSRRPRRRLERRNANKNIDYDALASASASFAELSSPSTPEVLRATRSLDLSPSYSNQTSFRIGGSIEGEVDLIYRSLGLSGPEDFAIPAADWEASRARRSASDLLPRSRLSPTSQESPSTTEFQGSGARAEIRVSENELVKKYGTGDGGIKGVRPPTLTPPEAMLISTRSAPPTISSQLDPSPSSVLAPPPSILLPELEKVGSTWDLVRAFAPDEEEVSRRRSFDSEEEEGIRAGGNREREEEEVARVRLGEETSEDIMSSSNDDDSSSTTTEAMLISPNGRFKRNIKSWMRGHLLGSGSFGTVYEGISE